MLEAFLKPIHTRRQELMHNRDYIYNLLRKGTETAQAVAEQTLSEVKSAMKLDYWNQ